MPVPLDPANWCREGLYTAEHELATAVVTSDRAVFQDDTKEGCPDVARTDCGAKAYVVKGDTVVVAQAFGDFQCAWYVGAKGNTVGWLRAADLAPEIVGVWRYYDNEVTITSTPSGLAVKGLALWHGLGDNVHLGEIDGALAPTSGGYTYDDGTCKVRFQRVGAWLALSDNGNCGGMNVHFSGVFRR